MSLKDRTCLRHSIHSSQMTTKNKHTLVLPRVAIHVCIGLVELVELGEAFLYLPITVGSVV